MEAFVILAMPNVWSILLIVLVALLLFGGRKIPELMKGVGQGMKEFKKATADEADVVDESSDSKSAKNEKA